MQSVNCQYYSVGKCFHPYKECLHNPQVCVKLAGSAETPCSLQEKYPRPPAPPCSTEERNVSMTTCHLSSCPVCGRGHLHTEVWSNSVEYKGVQKDLPLHVAVCNVCGVEQAGSEESRVNKQAMLAFRKEVDEVLKWTGKEDK